MNFVDSQKYYINMQKLRQYFEILDLSWQFNDNPFDYTFVNKDLGGYSDGGVTNYVN